MGKEKRVLRTPCVVLFFPLCVVQEWNLGTPRCCTIALPLSHILCVLVFLTSSYSPAPHPRKGIIHKELLPSPDLVTGAGKQGSAPLIPLPDSEDIPVTIPPTCPL